MKKRQAEEKARTPGNREGNSVHRMEDGMKTPGSLWSAHVLVAVLKKATCSRRLQPRHGCAEDKGPNATLYHLLHSLKPVCELSCSKHNKTHILWSNQHRVKSLFSFYMSIFNTIKQNLCINLGFHSIPLLNFFRRNGSKQYKIIMTNNCTLNMIINFKGQRHLNAL